MSTRKVASTVFTGATASVPPALGTSPLDAARFRSLAQVGFVPRSQAVPGPVRAIASLSVAGPRGAERVRWCAAVVLAPQQRGVCRPARRLAGSPDAGSLAGLLGGWVAGLDERRRAVFEHRIARDDRTLGEIGGLYHVSGERIRQMQIRLTAELSQWLQRPAAAARVAGLRALLEAACPVVAPWAEVVRAVPGLAGRIPGTGAFLSDLARLLFPELHRDGPWVGWRPVAGLRVQTVRLAAQSLPVANRPAVLAACRQALQLDGPRWDAWLGHCGLCRFRGTVVRSGATVAELAEAVLAEHGQAMSSAEIARQISVPSWLVRNCCLGSDGRFCRAGRGVFGLAEWRLQPYRGIRGHIAQHIAASGGQARLADIVADLSARFGVSKSSIYAYARGPEFTRTGDMVRLADLPPGRHAALSGALAPAGCAGRPGRSGQPG